MTRFIAGLVAVALSIAAGVSSQSVTVAVQNLVRQHLHGVAEAFIGKTRSQYVDTALAMEMACHNLNEEGTAVYCSQGGGVVGQTARFGEKGRVAWFSVDFFEASECSAARGYLVSQYGKALHTEELQGSDVYYWRVPKRKNRIFTFQEWPPESEPMPYGPPRMKQQCHVAYMAGQLVRN